MRRSRSGFTLLEVLVAMSILSVALLGIIQMQMRSGQSNLNARNITAAVNLARGKIEEMRRIRAYFKVAESAPVQTAPDLVDPEAGAINDHDDWASPDRSEAGPLDEDGKPGSVFTRSWNVVDDHPAAQIKTVRVRVAWREGAKPREVTLTTAIGLKNLAYYQ